MTRDSNRIRIKTHLGLFLIAGACALNSGLSPARAQSSQAYSTANENWDGMGELARIAQERFGQKFVSLTGELDYAELEPGDALLIIHPERELDVQSLTSFLADGGKLAILDDYGKSDSFLSKFPIRKINAPQKPYQTLNDNRQLAIAQPLSQKVAGAETGRHPIVANVEIIVTNHPKALSHPQLTEIAAIRADDGLSYPIAVTGIIGNRGKLVVVSDPSIGINFMLRYPGNRSFITGLIDYLKAPVRSPRKSVDSLNLAANKIHIATGAFTQPGSYGGHKHFYCS